MCVFVFSRMQKGDGHGKNMSRLNYDEKKSHENENVLKM